MKQPDFTQKSIAQIRDCIYSALQKGAEGADPQAIDRELSILSVRLEAMPREDVQPIVKLCDSLRTVTNPSSPSFEVSPSAFQRWCADTRAELLDSEYEVDFDEGMRDSARQEIRDAISEHQLHMQRLVDSYTRLYGQDDFISGIIFGDDEDEK